MRTQRLIIIAICLLPLALVIVGAIGAYRRFNTVTPRPASTASTNAPAASVPADTQPAPVNPAR